MHYLYAYYTVESGIKQLNWIELNMPYELTFNITNDN